jgi:uncharacterized membrane protein YkvA (DUF1232 family)
MESSSGSFLQSFVTSHADDLDLDDLVKHGGELVREQHSESLVENMTGFSAKLFALERSHPQLAEQLRFLIEFAADDECSSRSIRDEAIFAVLYCASDADLIPDDVPQIGFSDDAAVAETVLARNAKFFASYGRARGLQVPAVC